MALTVTMPQLGESVTEGTIGKWLKQPGDAISKYESIVEVVTDKVNAEVPAPEDGVMGSLIASEGTVVAVGQPICTIEQAKGKGEHKNGTGKVAETAATPAPTESVAAQQPSMSSPPQSSAPPPGDLHLTPAVRMVAREHGVDLNDVTGTGISGRITKKDVLEYVQRRDAGGAALTGTAARTETRSVAEAPRQSVPTVPTAPVSEGDVIVPLTPMRRAVAEHMVRSRQTSPHAWLMVEVDVTKVVKLRNSQKEAFQRQHGTTLTYLPFVARAVVDALRQFPSLNATWSDEGVVQKRDINIGIAVALEDNLIVPVIRNADQLTVTGLAVAMSSLAERARHNQLRVDDVQGGTFTLNNTGALGIVMSQSIINQPQAAILSMDTVVKRPVVIGGDAIAVRSMMNLGLSFDHRINDGLQVARFLQSIKKTLESIDTSTSLL